MRQTSDLGDKAAASDVFDSKLSRGAKAEYRVVKNTLAARASEGTILSGVKTY